MSRFRVERAAGAVVLAALMIGMPARAHAQQPPDKAAQSEASTHFNKGTAAYAAKDLPLALTEFNRAYELAPNFRVLYNIAKIQTEQKEWSAAARTYDKYLAEGGAQISVPRKAEVTDELRKIAGHVAQVTIRASTDGVDVSLDGVAVGKTPLASGLTMNAGAHKIAGTKEGRTPAQQTIEVVGGVAQTVSLELPEAAAAGVPVAASVPTRAATTTATPPRPENRTVMYVGIGATGALALGTAVFGVLALGASSTYDDKLNTFGVTHAELDDKQGTARTLVLVTGALGVATVASAAVTVYLVLSGKQQSQKERAPLGVSVERGTSASAFELMVGPGSIGAAGAF